MQAQRTTLQICTLLATCLLVAPGCSDLPSDLASNGGDGGSDGERPGDDPGPGSETDASEDEETDDGTGGDDDGWPGAETGSDESGGDGDDDPWSDPPIGPCEYDGAPVAPPALWAKTLPGKDAAILDVAGTFDGSALIGWSVDSRREAFAASLSATGEVRWTTWLGDSRVVRAQAVATDVASNVYVAGSRRDGPEGKLTGFVALLDAQSGEVIWQYDHDDAIDDEQPISLGVHPAGQAVASFPLADGVAVVVALDPEGSVRWSERRGKPGHPQWVHHVLYTHQGSIIVSGSFAGTIDAKSSVGGKDAFVTNLRFEDGWSEWTQTYGGPGDDAARGTALDECGFLAVVGDFEEEIEIGGDVLAGRGETDIFVAYLAPDLDLWTARVFGGEGAERAVGVRAIRQRGIVVGGYFNFLPAVAPTERLAEGDTDPFVMTLASNLAPAWFSPVSGEAQNFAFDVGPHRTLHVGGSFKGELNLGATPLTSAEGSAGYAAVYPL